MLLSNSSVFFPFSFFNFFHNIFQLRLKILVFFMFSFINFFQLYFACLLCSYSIFLLFIFYISFLLDMLISAFIIILYTLFC